jgi:hypothetical protein
MRGWGNVIGITPTNGWHHSKDGKRVHFCFKTLRILTAIINYLSQSATKPKAWHYQFSIIFISYMDIRISKGQPSTSSGLCTYGDLFPMMKELAKSGLYEVTHKESEEMKAWKLEVERNKGADEAWRDIAAVLIRKGFDTDEIVEISKLRKASVEKMRREMGE